MKAKARRENEIEEEKTTHLETKASYLEKETQASHFFRKKR